MSENELNSEMNEYIKYEETKDSLAKYSYWNLAIGLQQIDGLIPSKYLIDLAKDNIEGKLSNEEVENLVKKYYETKNLSNKNVSNEKECDLVSTRIVRIIDDSSFILHPTTIKAIHQFLFEGIYDFAGMFRKYNISKEEIILNGNSVNYGLYNQLDMMLDYDFKIEKDFDYIDLDMSQKIERFAEFTSRIWEVHPFGEGNTRTTAVFIVKYLRSIGFKVNNDLFKEHSVYFRNALVRSNYTNVAMNVKSTFTFLIKFFENLLINKQHELKSKDLIVKELF